MSPPPPIANVEMRVAMGASCKDADPIPKVCDAGVVYEDATGRRIQVMHNGLRVVCDGYYGSWMTNLIQQCRGHHEPQEERVFHEVVKRLPPQAKMIELGGFWAYYSLWFLDHSPQRQAVVLEPDPKHMAVGKANAALNGLKPKFLDGFAGAKFATNVPFQTEASGLLHLDCYSVPHIMEEEGWDRLDLLHCDIQGHEIAVLESCQPLFSSGRVRWIFVSTHAHQISGDPLTHQKCIDILQRSGARIVAEHDVHESFSGDGLIVACFGALPNDWATLELSHNRHSTSLFRSLAYDLNEANFAKIELEKRINRFGGLPDRLHETLNRAGLLLTLAEDGPLGAAGQSLLVPDDKIMSPTIVSEARWEYDNVVLFAEHLKNSGGYTLIDIGANIGLFSRQLQILTDRIERVLCLEPDDRNFSALRFNLAPFGTRSELFNIALSAKDGLVEFFRDTENIGNYSMNVDAMRERMFDQVQVMGYDAQTWLANHLNLAGPLAWKSDTQGFDEVIIARTPMEIWERIDVALVEVWRIDKPEFDLAALRDRLGSFPNRRIGDEEGVSVDDIVSYLSGSDWQFKDLLMWR